MSPITLTALGLTRPIADWAADLGIPPVALWARVFAFKWTVTAAVSVHPRHPEAYAERVTAWLRRTGFLERAHRACGTQKTP